jgi:1,4-alpha-glucan branching enzyme
VLERVDPRGLFEGPVAGERQPVRYRCQAGHYAWEVTDPYSFGPVLGPIDDFLIGEGTHHRLFDKLGAHVIDHEGARGVHFAVWAPNARLVSVVGDFNDWDGTRHPMRRRTDTGIWELFLPDIAGGRPYKYRIVGPDGTVQPYKADPFAFAAELRPHTASVTLDAAPHEWGDAAHRAFWAKADPRRLPISIYEVHPGSWRKPGDGREFYSWDELADRLIPMRWTWALPMSNSCRCRNIPMIRAGATRRPVSMRPRRGLAIRWALPALSMARTRQGWAC